ncbi:MAG: hypothetical protein R2713_07640 [Ilumatobacteraceae bacterium]
MVLSFHDPAAAADAVGALVDFASRPVGEQVVVHLPLRGGAGTVRDALNLLHDRSIDVGRIDLHEPTLDDVFISLTGSSAS